MIQTFKVLKDKCKELLLCLIGQNWVGIARYGTNSPSEFRAKVISHHKELFTTYFPHESKEIWSLMDADNFIVPSEKNMLLYLDSISHAAIQTCREKVITIQ